MTVDYLCSKCFWSAERGMDYIGKPCPKCGGMLTWKTDEHYDDIDIKENEDEED